MVDTEDHDVEYCMISNNARRILTMTMITDELYRLTIFDSDTLKKVFVINIQGHFIKAKEIAQNIKGTQFICPYYNNGVFNLILFDEHREICHYCINIKIGLDNLS